MERMCHSCHSSPSLLQARGVFLQWFLLDLYRDDGLAALRTHLIGPEYEIQSVARGCSFLVVFAIVAISLS